MELEGKVLDMNGSIPSSHTFILNFKDLTILFFFLTTDYVTVDINFCEEQINLN